MNSDGLTDAGKEHMMVKQRIGAATTVFSKGVGTLEDMSMWQLYKEMMDDGWGHRLLPLKGKKNICTAFQHGQPRVMWQTSEQDSVLFRHYMICLLQCDRNQAPAEAPHFKTDSSYQFLLGKEPTARRKPKPQLPVFL